MEREEHLRTTRNSIGEAVFTTDMNSCIVCMNPVAERLTGWIFHEAQGRLLTDVFHIGQAETLKPAFNPVEYVLEKEEVVGLANHTMLISWEGSSYQIADSTAPILSDIGETLGVPKEYFICIFLGVLDLRTMELTYSEGRFQDTPLVRMGDGTEERLISKGLILRPRSAWSSRSRGCWILP